MKMLHLAMIALAATLAAGAAGAQDYTDGDALNGRQLAEEFCARCHDVAPGGAFKMQPPSFASIAAYRPSTEIFGRIMFPPLHTAMPQMVNALTPDAVTDIVTYIVSLEGTAGQ